MKRKKLITVFVVFIVLLAGCSSGGSNDGDSTETIDEYDSFQGEETHPQDPGKQTIQDTYHYENGSTKQVTYNTEKIEQYLFEYINEYRRENSALEAHWDSNLDSSASAKSYHMHENDYYAHESPGGLSHTDFMSQVGNCDGPTGENLNGIAVGEYIQDVGRTDSNKVVARHIFNQWRTSDDGHREIMLFDGAAPSDTDMGVGVAIDTIEGKDEIYLVYVTLHVCT